MKEKIQKSSQGFTLVEILVVATIISILSAVGIAGFQAVTRGGRDALRKTDLEQLRSSLEIYKSENGAYPTGGPTCVSVNGTNCCQLDNFSNGGYIKALPKDPLSTARYCYVGGGSSYILCAHLENSTSAPAYCSGAGICGQDCKYAVTNP